MGITGPPTTASKPNRTEKQPRRCAINPFHSIKFFVLCHGLLQLSQLLVSGYLKSIVSTIEKRFGLSSQTSGMLSSLNEIGSAVFIVFVSYFGSRVHRPRLIGCGGILVSVAAFTMALPHFIMGRYIYDRTTTYNVSTVSDICHLMPKDQNLNSENCSVEKNSSDYETLSLLIVGQLLLGVGGVPIQPFGISYVDDFASNRNSPFYLGILFAVSVLGPAFGFVLGSAVLRLYVDIDKLSAADIDLEFGDPRWVGAWWLGFLMAASFVGIVSVPYFFFPKEMPKEYFLPKLDDLSLSFIAETDNEKEEWVEALRDSIAEALSNYEVAEQIWAVESNMRCADCGAPKPEWASINLCLVVCKRCAGEHRALGPGISKIRSLKMDKKVWTEQMIKMFQCISNRKANQFWAANIPPSEAINETSSSMERRRFISAKYRQGKYRKYHLLFGNQEELNKALCAAVVTGDLEETMSLVFCGADVSCFSGDPDLPSPADLAQQAGQTLQVEFLNQNKNSETPRLELGYFDRQYYVAPPSITHNGYLYKTASMGKPITERKSREEFSKRWCVLDNGLLSYYDSDRNSTPNGTIEMREVVCLSINSPAAHGFEHTFEVFTDSERLFMFGTDSAQSNKAWVKSIAKSFLPAGIDLMNHEFERIGRLQYKDGLNLEQAKVGWFALVSSTLFAWFQDSDKEEAINLQKLQELSEQSDHDVLVLVEKRRTLYIQAVRKLDFIGWNSSIQRAAASAGNTLSEQQLTDEDIPVVVDRCIAYITQYGLTSEGIYRKSGQKSKTTNLLEMFLKDARSVRLREGDHQVDDVSNTLKRFFRESIGESVFTDQVYQDWLHTSMIPEERQKILQYQKLFACLPKVNRATLKALINHLYCVQRLSDKNQMTVHNLAIVFGPTLFQTDGQDNKAGRVVEDLINHFIDLFNVDELQLKKQLDEIVSIIKLRDACLVQSSQNAGDFICTVYLEEKKSDCELSLKVPATMTAQELTDEILYLRKLITKEKDNWCCFEVIEREEMERPLHYTEKVLPILQSLGADSYLVVKKNMAIDTMLMYLASKVADQKHGMVKFREERKLGLGVGSFSDRYFMLTGFTLRLYKEVRSNKPEKEWPVKSLKVYLGVKKKFKPPTCWGFTIVYENKERHEKQQWYVCCDTQMEQREWLATFLYIQHDGNVWPVNSSSSRTSRSPPDARFNNVSLIPLRGNASEMRNSVAAFSADPLSIFKKQ
ncbi:arf-GAP with Rho-GAP domain, ANK repeat and PH domain-containing protein 1-like [Rhincodon typus]|uniref:arf-GAP with Rho-GAP domain, ANK repeat and PH domain-containing protein 1-like n=1 Tax=Rhincodon typus TaxID=259920 RepID=UPI00202FBFAE|nr:arf-GAP with Rho-GAP domain, ANK repeat and PH domain-containing protein 1-like [Rhincodon typus]